MGDKIGSAFYSFSLVSCLCSWCIVILQFCACLQSTATWFTYDIYLQLICSFLDSVAIEVMAEGWAKCPVLIYQVLPEYLLEIQISMYIWKEGRKERILLNYPLQIETSVYILALSPNSSLLFHFFLETSDSVWILRVAFFVVNLFHCISFCILPTRDIIYYCLSLCDWLHLVCDPPSSILVTIIGTISVAIFHDWVTVHCMYVHISFNL